MNRYIIRKINDRWIVARGCRIIDSSGTWQKALALACWYARNDRLIPNSAPVILGLARSTP